MIILLAILAILFIVAAIIQDFRTREVPNWLNFSLAIFALAIRAFYSIFNWDISYFLFGLFGLAVFFILGHVFYYGRLFAGGDAKLMIALGAIIPFSNDLYTNILIFLVFIIALFFFGAAYSLVYSFVLMLQNLGDFSDSFKEVALRNKNYIFSSGIFAILFLILFYGTGFILFLVSGILVFVLPHIYFYTKAIEDSALVKKVSVNELTVGDWLLDEINIDGKKIKPNWEGLTEAELMLLKKQYNKKVKVKYGIPFTPAFILAFVFILLVEFLWNSNWSLVYFF
jgi:Flp pilus assembly protein protease CpaA